MGVPYLNIHYQLLQSDLSAPKYTICLFLSYIFLCSHTWISAILVVSRVYYSCTSYSVISKGGIPFPSPDFQNLTAPTFIMALSLMFTCFCTGVCMCVCVSPKFQRQKSIFGGIVQSTDLFFKRQSITENGLLIREVSGQVALSCKPYQDYNAGRERWEATGCSISIIPEARAWSFWLGSTVTLFEQCAWSWSKEASVHSLKSKLEHTFSTYQWWVGGNGTQWCRAGTLSPAFWRYKHLNE